MKIYEVKGPCPDLSIVLAKAIAELKEGEEAKIKSSWKYVVRDIESVSRQAGLEMVSINNLGDYVEVVVRKSTPPRPL
ncbi:MAG: sulfurtransferase TusA family protein [Pyrobaculum sp.]